MRNVDRNNENDVHKLNPWKHVRGIKYENVCVVCARGRGRENRQGGKREGGMEGGVKLGMRRRGRKGRATGSRSSHLEG